MLWVTVLCLTLIVGALAVARRQPPPLAFLASSDETLHIVSIDGWFDYPLRNMPEWNWLSRLNSAFQLESGEYLIPAGSRLYRLSLNRLTLEPITPNTDRGPSIVSRSPDGQWIIYTSGSGADKRVYLIRPDGTDRRLLDNQLASSQFTWSPDGQWLYGAGPADQPRFFRINIISGSIQTLSAYQIELFPSSWSTDGQWLYYHIINAFDHEAGPTFRIDLDGRVENLDEMFGDLLPGTYYPRIYSYAPDGDWLYVSVPRDIMGQEADLYRLAPDGSKLQQLTDTPGYSGILAWGPDGDWLVVRNSWQGNSDLWIMRPDGSQQQRLSQTDGRDFLIGWSPDRQWVYFQSFLGGSVDEVFRARIDGSDYQQVTDFKRDQISAYGWLSPDGVWGIISRGDTRTLYSIHLDSGAVYALAYSAAFVGWSPDSQWMLFYTSEGIQRVRPDGTDIHNYGIEPGVSWFHVWLPPIDRPWSPVGLLAAALVLGMTGIMLAVKRRV